MPGSAVSVGPQLAMGRGPSDNDAAHVKSGRYYGFGVRRTQAYGIALPV